MICGEKCPRQIRVSLVLILMTVSGSGAAVKPDVTQLANLARQTTQKLGSRGVAVWADRAWALDLGGEPGPSTWFPSTAGRPATVVGRCWPRVRRGCWARSTERLSISTLTAQVGQN